MKIDRQGLYEQWQPTSGRRSLAAFAREVLAAGKEILGKTPSQKVRTLEVELGRWLTNDTDFSKHPELQQALAQVLEEDVATLFPRPGRRDPALHLFPEFPALGAFDPRRDEPCRERGFEPLTARRSSSDWSEMLDDVLTEMLGDWFESLSETGGCSWFAAPPGAGRSFVAHWHRHRTPACTVITCGTLAAAELGGLPKGPLVIEVESSSPDDMKIAQELLTQGVVLVLAPFERPRPEREAKRGALDLASSWCDYRWRGGRSWRRAFVAWTSARIVRLELESLLDVRAVLKWLEAIDPRCEFFNTPGDLLPILRAAHEEGEARLRQRFGPAFAHNWQQRLVGEVTGSGWRERWCREEGVSTLERMVSAWWATPELPWGEGLTLTEWETLVPADAVPADEDRHEQLRVAVGDLGRAGGRDRATRAKEAAKLVVQLARPRDVVLALKGARLLRERGTDRLLPAPRWGVDLLVREVVRQAVVEGPPDVWGRWSVDPARQRLLDHALLELPTDALQRVVARAVAAFRSEDLGAIGAVETLFLAVGRRLARGETFDARTGKHLASLLAHQFSTMVCRSTDGLPGPRTRGGPWESHTGGAAWIAACWDWSLAIEKAPPDLPPGYAWLFPGWLPPSLNAVPLSLLHHHSFSGGSSLEEEGCLRLFWLAHVVLLRCEGAYASGPHGYPTFIDAAVVSTVSQRAWPDEALLTALRHIATFDLLTVRIESLPKDEQHEVLERIWFAILHGTASLSEFFGWLGTFDSSDQSQRRQRSRLAVLLDGQFPVQEICERIASPGRTLDVARSLTRTPAEHRGAVARAIWHHHPDRSHELVDVLSAQGRELLDVLVEMCGAAPSGVNRSSNIAFQAARAVWRVAPDVARELEEQVYARGDPHNPWTSGRAGLSIGEMVSLVERHPEREPPPDLLRWFARMLVEAGPLAGRVHALLERAKWRDLLPPKAENSPS